MKKIRITIIMTTILIGMFTLSACERVDNLDSESTSETTASTSLSETGATSSGVESPDTNAENSDSDISAVKADTTSEMTSDISDTSVSEPDAASEMTSDISDASVNEPDTASEMTSDISGTSVSEPDAASESEPDTAEILESGQEYMYTAYELTGALDYIDRLGASASFDESSAFTDENGNTFAKVTGTQFSDTSDLREYMESYLTDSFLNNRYSGILGTDSPRYIDVDGTLYGKTDARGGGFPWTGTPLKIENVTDSSFTILAEYDNYGALETMGIDVVMDNGSWKINWVAFGL